MRIAVKTLGCKVNQAESDLMVSALASSGFEVVDFSAESDIYIINSCAVTKEAERKTRQCVRQALRRNAQGLVLLTGCAARLFWQREYNPWGARVVLLPGREKAEEIFAYLRDFTLQSIQYRVVLRPRRSRVWVKVEDGCDHFCHYCIVPYLRGPVRSESPDHILQVVQGLEGEGVREIVLCGINLGYFGRDNGSSLMELLRLLIRETSQVRFRLSSLEPFLVDEHFIEQYFSLGKRMCPHFHLPLQSGSDRILERMGRGYNTAFYRSLVATIRRLVPDIALTTDIIVGFPGEEEEDFRKTLAFCQEMAFSRMHVFPFSPREGTPAFLWEREYRVPHPEKKRREEVLLALGRQLSCHYHERFVGREVEMVGEFLDSPYVLGYSENYIPVRVRDVSQEMLGSLLRIRVERAHESYVLGYWVDGTAERRSEK